VTVTIAQLRLRMTLNHFKRLVLGQVHVPKLAQGRALFEELAKRDNPTPRRAYLENEHARPEQKFGMRADPRTWDSWFKFPNATPKKASIAALDDVAMDWLRADLTRGAAPELRKGSFYRELVFGGLLKTMLKDVQSDDPRKILRARAAGYEPVSPLHLHVDALELLTFRESIPDISQEEIVAIGGARIFDILFSWWGALEYPGIVQSAYAGFWSEEREAWRGLSDADRERRRLDLAFVWQDDPEAAVRASLLHKPNRALLGNEVHAVPARVYRLLFAIGCDSDFLREDVLPRWALDLATAGAAAVALFYGNDPYVSPHEEQLILNAIDAMMFGRHVDGVAAEHRANLWGGDVVEVLRAAMNSCQVDWGLSGNSNFYRARQAYRVELLALGIDVDDIFDLERREPRQRSQGSAGTATTSSPKQFVHFVDPRQAAAQPVHPDEEAGARLRDDSDHAARHLSDEDLQWLNERVRGLTGEN
jgi:hypothetical protein